MRPILIPATILIVLAFAAPVRPANVEETSWGCQVLLCAALQNPSWHGVPYCVPPMTKLIAAMKEPGFSWPICHEANAGKPGHETYDDCPSGTTVSYSWQGSNSWRGEPDQCIKTIDICRSLSQRGSDVGRKGAVSHRNFVERGDTCVEQIGTPRPRRANPYFFDIPNDEGVKQRFWFNLKH